MRLSPLCALLLLLPGLLRAQPAEPSLQNLITNSPFGTAAAANVNGLPTGPLEFRGTFVDGGERFFSLLDPATRRSEWVGLNEAGRAFTVKSYDAEREVIIVDFQGRTHDLKLHAARISALPPVQMNNTPPPANANAARPAVGPIAPDRIEIVTAFVLRAGVTVAIFLFPWIAGKFSPRHLRIWSAPAIRLIWRSYEQRIQSLRGRWVVPKVNAISSQRSLERVAHKDLYGRLLS